MMTSSSPIFLVTLGGKAQVATFALDCLLDQGVSVRDVVVFHYAPADPTHRLHRALSQVQQQFVNGRYPAQGGELRTQTHLCRFRAVPMRDRNGRRLVDIDSAAAVNGVWQTMNQVIGELKAQNRELHLCLTGGRRLMGLLGMSVAALHFTYRDRLWHLYTPDDLCQAAGEGKILHAPPNGATPFLLEVPIMPGSETFPMLRQLLSASPAEVIAARRTHLEKVDQTRCQQVWQKLTRRQREVLSLLASGQSPQDVAIELCITLGTVSTHQHAIYNACREAWLLPNDESLDYHWVERHFGRWSGLP